MYERDPVSLTHFLGCLALTAHALLRTGLILSGFHWTKAGRRIYRH